MKTLGKTKFITFVVIGSLISLFVYNKYSVYKKFFPKKALENLSDDLGRYTMSYMNNNEVNDLVDSQEFEKMKLWLKKSFVLNESERELLDYGYRIKYFPKEDVYVFCLLGPDRKESDAYFAVPKKIAFEKKTVREIPSFSSFLFMSNNFDIILFGYK